MIPIQLKSESFRFSKVRPKAKEGIGKWTTTANYKYDDPELLKHIKLGGNYGVLGGYGNLIIIDADSEVFDKRVKDLLPRTFTVKTSKFHHYYYICKLSNPDSISLKDPNSENGKAGDIQTKGFQVVGPGSTHPTGRVYEIAEDISISTISEEQLLYCCHPYLVKKEARAIENLELEKGKNINLNIRNIIDTSGLQLRNDEYYGPHPIHGSDGGSNFWVNPSKNVWTCFRHRTGGGPLHWLAIQEGILKCEDCTPGALKGKKFKDVCKIAIQKGYMLPEELENKADTSKLLAYNAANELMSMFVFKTLIDTEEIYYFKDGIFVPGGEQLIKTKCRVLYEENATKHVVNEVLEHIKSCTYTDRKEFDSTRDYLCLKNGILNWKTKELQEHTPDYLFMKKLNVNYDPDQTCPNITKFLSEVLAEDDIPLFLEIVGYCLYPSYPIHKAFMFHGEGSNGKSTCLFLIERLLGSNNVSNIALQNLEKRHFSVGELYGKLANIYADLPNSTMNTTSTFKMLTGEDTIQAEKKFAGHFKFINHAKLLFSANTLPPSMDDTKAYFRRWIILDFANSFESNPDPFLKDKIGMDEEITGLLNLALEHLIGLINQGRFSQSKAAEKLKEDYLKRSDSISAFCMDSIEIDNNSYILSSDLYAYYTEYCRNNNLTIQTQTKFVLEFKKKYSVTDYRALIDGRRLTSLRGVKLKGKHTNKIYDVEKDIAEVMKDMPETYETAVMNIFEVQDSITLDYVKQNFPTNKQKEIMSAVTRLLIKGDIMESRPKEWRKVK